jgi:AcrR family transcriptional regulator
MQPPDKEHSERRRIGEALVGAVAARGYANTTLEMVLERAGVDRAAFHAHYRDLDACFTEVWERIAREFREAATAAYAAADSWRDGIAAVAWRFCRFLQEDHPRARFFMVELEFAGERVQAGRDVITDGYVDLVHLGRSVRPEGEALPRATAEGIIGAIWKGAARAVQADNFAYLPSVVPQTMYLTVLPYLGPEAAQQELRRGPADIALYERGEI